MLRSHIKDVKNKHKYIRHMSYSSRCVLKRPI